MTGIGLLFVYPRDPGVYIVSNIKLFLMLQIGISATVYLIIPSVTDIDCNGAGVERYHVLIWPYRMGFD